MTDYRTGRGMRLFIDDIEVLPIDARNVSTSTIDPRAPPRVLGFDLAAPDRDETLRYSRLPKHVDPARTPTVARLMVEQLPPHPLDPFTRRTGFYSDRIKVRRDD